MSPSIDDRTLMALADGELDAAEAARVKDAIAGDTDLAERYAVFAETRALLQTNGNEDVATVPPALLAAVRAAAARTSPEGPRLAASQPETSRDRPTPARRQAPTWPLAWAAAIALVVGGVLGASLERWRGATTGAEVGSLADLAVVRLVLADAYGRLPSGETLTFADRSSGRSGRIAMTATHRLDDGSLCRQADIASEAAGEGVETILACRTRDGSWTRRAFVSRPARGGYVPASGADDPMLAVLDGLGVHERLSREAERTALADR